LCQQPTGRIGQHIAVEWQLDDRIRHLALAEASPSSEFVFN
jgi:hypothetical protein